MASSTIFLYLASLLIFTISSSNAITNDQISQICSKAISSSVCSNLLHSTPGVASADLKGVGSIVLGVSKSKASQTNSIIPGFVSRASNPTLKQRYNACKGSYADAIADINEAKQALNGNDPDTLNIRVSAAQTSVGDCSDEFDNPPADPSDLTKRNQDLFDTLDVVLVISTMI